MKKNIIIILCMAIFILSGCGSGKGEANETYYGVELTDEQVNFLVEERLLSVDLLDYLSYDNLTMELLGSGLELYNQTSGVEVFGVDYVSDTEIDFDGLVSTSDRKITYDEAYALRLKEKDMRLEDFLNFNFITQPFSYSDGGEMLLPLDEFPDTYVSFSVSVDGNNIHMSVPHFFYSTRKDLLGGNVFSILYDTMLFNAWFENGDMSDDNKIIWGTVYGTTTPHSIILGLHNNKDKKYSYNNTVRIYRGEGDDKEYLEEFSVETKEKTTIRKNSCTYIPVTFGSGDKELPSGTYTLEFGKGAFECVFEI